MKNTLTDLNNYLFEQLERLNDDSLSEEQLEREMKKTDAVVKVSTKIIEAGEIRDLRIQVPFVLIPSQVIRDDRGRKIKTERACKYVADFVYWDCHRRRKVVEDTKGVRTKEYIIKKKLMLYVHGIVIYEV